MPPRGKCNGYPTLQKNRQKAELQEVVRWGERGLEEQRALDCRARCVLGRHFMLSAETKTTELAVRHSFPAPPSNSVTVCYACLLFKPGWGCKVGAGAVVVSSSWPCSPVAV